MHEMREKAVAQHKLYVIENAVSNFRIVCIEYMRQPYMANIRVEMKILFPYV